MLTVLSVLVFLSVSVLAWALLPNPQRRQLRKRIFSEVSDKKRPSIVAIVGNALTPINRRLPGIPGYCTWSTKLMEGAGLRLAPLHWLAIQELGALTGLIVYAATMGLEKINQSWLMVFVIAGFCLPVMWLNNRTQARRLTITRDLPEIVDLLNLSVSAGSDFMSALGRIVREFRPCPVRDELGIVLQEVRVGKRRRDALRGFALRLRSPEASTFARTLIQVDRMGTGMAEALLILSEDMRLQRYHWAERFAQQAPMKMLVPLIFSLGSAMVIVAGPILLQFFRGDLMKGPQMTAAEHARPER